MLNVKLVRIAAGLSQVALASEIKTSQTRVSLIERELAEPRPSERVALAKALGTSAAALFRPVAPPARRSARPELVEVKR